MSGRRPGTDPVSEAELRRALRLDMDELPPRLDPAALMVAARSDRGRVTMATAASALVAAVAVLAAAGTGGQVDPSPVVGPVVDAVVGVAVWAGVPAWQVLSALAAPTPAIVSLAAVIFAVAYERAHREERADALAS